MKDKIDVYISEKILWNMVQDMVRENPNDDRLGERVRELVTANRLI